MIAQYRIALVNHVLRRLEYPLLKGAQTDLNPYLNLLPSGEGDSANIFNLLPGSRQIDRTSTLERFQRESFPKQQHLRHGESLPSPVDHFDLWSALIETETRNHIGARREQGVSLFTEFKVLSALVHASRGNPDSLGTGFRLVRADFPGVQRVIYTIASDGATKGVRGRSFFLQLLAECMVRRLLNDLDLPFSNALYIAGGRFLLLVPPDTDISPQAIKFNRALLELFEGDLSVTLSSAHLPARGLKETDDLQRTMNALRSEELRQKTQPFLVAMKASLFEPYGVGSEFYCAISRREPKNQQEIQEARTSRDKDEPWISREHQSFERLAEDIGQLHSESYLYFAPSSLTEIHARATYSGLLHNITGWSAVLLSDKAEIEQIRQRQVGGLLKLNNSAFDSAREDGFRFIATFTPHVTQADKEYIRTKDRAHIPEGTIRPFELLTTRALKNNGFARLGMLRMDVDSLGDVFSGRKVGGAMFTLTRQIALSRAVSEFFEVYLPLLCAQIETELQRKNSIYLLYAGGDDLFIVGEWDLMPQLAQIIHQLWHEYTDGKLTISAGIELVPQKFPFYVAANQAKTALDERAKAYIPRGESEPRKNAICFLNEVFGWGENEDWEHLLAFKNDLLDVTKHLKDQQTLIRNTAQIYARWRSDYIQYGDSYLKFGPFHWLTAYQFSRIGSSVTNSNIKQKIKQIQTTLLTDIRLGGVGARWAEFERRSDSDSKSEENANAP